MTRVPSKIVPHGDGYAVTIPDAALTAAGLKPGDEVALVVRPDGVLEVHRASADELALNDAFEWALGRYGRTFGDLAQ